MHTCCPQPSGPWTQLENTFSPKWWFRASVDLCLHPASKSESSNLIHLGRFCNILVLPFLKISEGKGTTVHPEDQFQSNMKWQQTKQIIFYSHFCPLCVDVPGSSLLSVRPACSSPAGRKLRFNNSCWAGERQTMPFTFSIKLIDLFTHSLNLIY